MYSIELFTGAGGLALGTHRAGFHHLAVVEYDHNSCDTLRLNRSRHQSTGVDWPIYESDVRSFDYSSYTSTKIDLLAGGAPCQPFSLGGKHTGHSDERNMFPQIFRAVRELMPRAILLENVRGLLRKDFSSYFQYIINQLTLPFITVREEETWEQHHIRLQKELRRFNHDVSMTYDVKWRCYNTADFGIPQERHRVFIVAFRRDLGAHWIYPNPTHSQDALLYAQYISGDYWQEHGMHPLPVPTRFARRVQYLASSGKPLFEERWRTVRDVICDLPEPVNYDLKPHINNHVGIPDARIYPGHTGSPWDWPAKTIKAGNHGNPGGENMLRREDGTVRYFTVRELARIQTFPDEWHFANSWTESRRQLGNAVPVLMAEILARLIRKELCRLDSAHLQSYCQASLLDTLSVEASLR